MKIRSIALPALLLGSMALYNCGGGDENANNANDTVKKDTVAVVTDTLPASTVDGLSQFKFDMLLANLPSPLEIINDLNAAKAEFKDGLVLDKKKADKASTTSDKAFLMGAYTVDMSYDIDYGKGTEALSYSVSVKKLSEDLGISKYYDKSYYDRFNNNLSNRDSLLNMINGAVTLTDKYCRTNDNLKTSTYIFAGSWLEGLHIAVSVLGDQERNDNNKTLYARLWQQRFHSKNLLEALDSFKSDEGAKRIMPLIKDIQTITDKVQNDADMKASDVKKVAEKVAKLREVMFGK